MNEAKLKNVQQLVAHYNLQIEIDGMMITKINDQVATLDARNYMPDQLIDLLCQVIATKMKADLFRM